TVLAGDFQRGARLWDREDATIEVSTEHSDFFIRNLLCVRAEERLTLAISQTAYFAKATLPAGATSLEGRQPSGERPGASAPAGGVVKGGGAKTARRRMKISHLVTAAKSSGSGPT